MFKWVMVLFAALLFYYAVMAFTTINTTSVNVNAMVNGRTTQLNKAMGR